MYTFDLSKITIAEYREFGKSSTDDETQDIILAKVTGMTVEEIVNLNMLEFKRLVRAFYRTAMEPLADPT